MPLPVFKFGRASISELQRGATNVAKSCIYNEHDLVFCQSNGRPLHPSDLRKDFQRILKAAGLPRIRFHDLRHTAAALRLAQGDYLKVIQELLGHASAGFTLQVYGHLAAGLQEQSAKTLAARLFGEK